MSSNKTSNKRGIALGAVLALLATIFSVTPAQAAATDGANFAIRPVAGTTLGGMVYNEFDLYAQSLPGNDALTSLKWKIDVTSGYDMDIIYFTKGSAITEIDQDTAGGWGSIAADTEATSKSFASTVSSGLTYLTVKAYSSSAAASWSSVTLAITAWVDSVTVGDGTTSGTGVIDADEWRTTKTVTLYNMGNLPVTAGWTAPDALDTYVTASATITGVNFRNLGNGKFFLAVSSSASIFSGAKQNSSSPLAGSVLDVRSGVLSSSWAITTISESQSVSFQVRYDSAGTGGTYTAGVGKAATAYAATAPGIDTLSISSTANANITGSHTAYTIRPNQTYTVKVMASTGSTSVSKAVTVTLGGTSLVTSSKLLSINGGAFVTAYPANGITVTTGTDGTATFTLATSGFVAGNTLTVDASVGNVSATQVVYTVADPTYAVIADDALVATAPGTAVALGFTVKDQWNQNSAATNHYIKLTKAGTGFSYTTTVSYHAVAAGLASIAFTPEAATTTGSASVVADIVKLVNGAYVSDGSGAATTVTVTSATSAFSTGLAASYAASVSYFANTVSWTTVTGKVVITGSAVTVTGDSSLIFRKSAAVPATTSGSIVLASDSSADYSFQVASLHSGNHTMTLTNGSATTTSLLVVAEAGSDMGSTITWDASSITPGKTKILVGTLTDANGNAVNTTGVGRTAGDSGTASIVVTYAGDAGVVVGTVPTETDADGKFRISVLTSAADEGTLTVTAVYLPQGASTATGNKVTSVNAVSIGAAAASADQKVNAGSFKGYVAIYAKGYAGQRLSAKVGNDWVVVESLASNFERVVEYTGAGYTIAVRIYIDRVLVDTITVTTK